MEQGYYWLTETDTSRRLVGHFKLGWGWTLTGSEYVFDDDDPDDRFSDRFKVVSRIEEPAANG